MTPRSRILLALVAVASLVGVAGCSSDGSSTADAAPADAISVQFPMVDRPANPSVAAVRMVVHNPTDEADSLIGVSSPVARTATIHRSQTDSAGRSTMVAQRSLRIAARSDVYFEPSGLHVMLTGITEPLAIGDRVPLTLTFRHAGTVTATAKVVAPGTIPEVDHGD